MSIILERTPQIIIKSFMCSSSWKGQDVEMEVLLCMRNREPILCIPNGPIVGSNTHQSFKCTKNTRTRPVCCRFFWYALKGRYHVMVF
jgi:hypothetical protein